MAINPLKKPKLDYGFSTLERDNERCMFTKKDIKSLLFQAVAVIFLDKSLMSIPARDGKLHVFKEFSNLSRQKSNSYFY